MAEAVRAMFSKIAPGYDRANDVLSFGLHRRWRRRAVRLARAPLGGSVLDVATGTGDLAFRFRHAVGPSGRVVGVDFSPAMLGRARRRAARSELDVEFREGDALELGFEAASFDVTSIAFGIRNVDDPVRCLREMARVTREGGRVIVLEFGQPGGIRKRPYRWYSKFIMPRVGGWLTGDRSAYEYLPRTAASFPYGEDFVELMRRSNAFDEIQMEPLSGGISYVYVGRVRVRPTIKAPKARGRPR